MKSGNRSALMVALALGMNAGLGAPSLAQQGEVIATSAKIAELSRAGKYAEAIPLAQGQLERLEKKYGPFNRDVAGALNNLVLLYADQGRDAEAEPLFGRALAIREKSLPQAMLAYLGDASSPKNAYPAFWGPFALIGEGTAR